MTMVPRDHILSVNGTMPATFEEFCEVRVHRHNKQISKVVDTFASTGADSNSLNRLPEFSRQTIGYTVNCVQSSSFDPKTLPFTTPQGA